MKYLKLNNINEISFIGNTKHNSTRVKILILLYLLLSNGILNYSTITSITA